MDEKEIGIRISSRLCPYDPNHRVLAKRFQYHIMRCAKVFHKRLREDE